MQGAELNVLRGAVEVLRRTKAVFVEVSVFRRLYHGGALLGEIREFLENSGFHITSLGVDSENGTGNALFARNPAATSSPG